MLQQLSIRNYAIIDELEISFSRNLNIITGETGAGKSIIVGALGLILGERADTGVLVNKENKLVVEGVFNIAGREEVTAFLKENDWDADDELVVRREIAVNGKSRAFVNDTPVVLSQLQLLSGLLVDLHQQFDTLSLGEKDFQLKVIDALADTANALSDYRTVFFRWQKEKEALDLLLEEKQQFEKEADYNRFQYQELEEADFSSDELENIEAELKLLTNAEDIKRVLGKAYSELEEGETPLVQTLKSLTNQLSSYTHLHTGLEQVVERLQSLQIELKDIAGEVNNISESVLYDAEKIEQYNDRLSLGYKLQKKHGVSSTQELMAIREVLEEKLQAVLQIDDAIQEKEKIVSQLQEELRKKAAAISASRKKQVSPFEEKIKQLLVQVGMPNASLKVEITDAVLSATGADNVAFLFDANLPVNEKDKAARFQPLRKVASGGELSRLMLCIKSLVAQRMDLPTLIFDEIDSGISGEAAKQVGVILKELSANRQVICITHQPQIAGKADAHYFVYKQVQNDEVKTHIRTLTIEERIDAIAQMMSGEKPTAAALENAKEMVENG